MDWAKENTMVKKELLHMNLQTFADTDGANEPSGSDTSEEEKGTVSFDDFLKNDWMQAEFDRRVNKALNTAKSKWDASKNEELSEAEKLAKMTKSEKEAYEMKKRLEALEERERTVARKELESEARGLLTDAGLPSGLYSFLDYSSADKCKESVSELKEMWNSELEKAVSLRLKGDSGLKETRGKEKADPIMDEAIKLIMGR